MRYHYYIGLQLPVKLRDRITRIQQELHDPIETLEPLEPHITLLPPPAVEDIDPRELTLHARAAARSVWPLDLALQQVVTFGGHAVALRVESDGIYGLQRQLISLLPFEAPVRYYPNPTFLPHVTIVQALRGKTLPSHLIEQYRERLEPILPLAFQAKHLTLFQWTGPRAYEAKPL